MKPDWAYTSDLQAIILAGGRATRLGNLAERVPKSLLPVAGRPFLEHQLELLSASGIRRVILCLGHLAGAFRAYHGQWKDLWIEHSVEPEPLGTGGAIRHALPHLGASFCVLYGDSYLNFSYHGLWEKYRHSKVPVLGVYKNNNQWDKSNARVEKDRVIAYSKKSQPDADCIDAGIALLEARDFRAWPDARFDLADLYEHLTQSGRFAAWHVPDRFYEIGSVAGWEELNRKLEPASKIHLREGTPSA